jgi:hypothetical protein
VQVRVYEQGSNQPRVTHGESEQWTGGGVFKQGGQAAEPHRHLMARRRASGGNVVFSGLRVDGMVRGNVSPRDSRVR